MSVLDVGGVSGDLERAEEAAVRFLASTKALRERLSKDKRFAQYGYLTGSRETGSVRRASLDLTRALADMRKR